MNSKRCYSHSVVVGRLFSQMESKDMAVVAVLALGPEEDGKVMRAETLETRQKKKILGGSLMLGLISSVGVTPSMIQW